MSPLLLILTICLFQLAQLAQSSKVETVLVVGAGPVGLTTVANYLDRKVNNPPPTARTRKRKSSSLFGSRDDDITYKFVFVEKRSSYSRLQMLALWKSNWDALPQSIRVALHQRGCIRTSPFLIDDATCFKFPQMSGIETLPQDMVFAFVMMDYENILKSYLVETSLRNYDTRVHLNERRLVNFFLDGVDDRERYNTFLSRKRLPPVHFVYGTFKGLSWKGHAQVKINDEIDVELKADVILATDGANSFVRRNVLNVEYEPLDLPVNYGGAFSHEIDGLQNSMIRPIPLAEDVRLHNNATLHRIRIFRQSTNQLYIGVSLSPQEYELMLQGSNFAALASFWDEMSRLLRISGIDVFPRTLSRPIQPLHKSVFQIIPSKAAKVVRTPTKFGPPVFLLGDAALSPNFITYSGLNAGLVASEYIVKRMLESKLKSKSTKKQYSRIIKDLAEVIQTRASSVSVQDWNQVQKVCSSVLCTGANCPSGMHGVTSTMSAEMRDMLLNVANGLNFPRDVVETLSDATTQSPLCHATLVRGDGSILSLDKVSAILESYSTLVELSRHSQLGTDDDDEEDY